MRFVAVAVFWLVAAVGVQAGEVTSSPAFFVGGIQVNEPDHDHWVESLGDAGMNTVAVTVYASQGDWDSDHLWFADEEPSVVAEIRAAKSKGLAVVLILRVAVDHAYPRNKFIWHGMIMPKSNEAIRSWFVKYTSFVTKWARIAEAEGVDVLGVGSELNALNATLPLTRTGLLRNYYGFYWYQRLHRDRALQFADRIERRHLWVRGFENYDTLEEFVDARFELTTAWARRAYLRDAEDGLFEINERRRLIDGLWRRLIRRTRAVYGGRLTYAANFDSYQTVGFWSQLDFIGINAYFSLRSGLNDVGRERMRSEFERSWTRILSDVSEFRGGQGLGDMPFLFTELGYTFRQHSTVEPWAHGGFSVVGWKGERRQFVVWDDQPVDYDERRMALDALRSVEEANPSGLSGILYWKLSTDKSHERIEPFVLHIGPGSRDPLRKVLAGFAPSGSVAGR